MHRKPLWGVTQLAALLGLVACVSCARRDSAPAPQVATTVGANGGRLRFPIGESELVVSVPAGALEGDILLSAYRHAGTLPGAASVAVEVGPHGTKFRKPVKLTFRMRRAELAPRAIEPLLRVATITDGRWELLPTRQEQNGVFEGETTHFSTFALVAPCMATGTGTDFPLTGCPVFEPRVQTSAPVALDLTAQSISMRITSQAVPTGGLVTFTVSGLAPSTPYYLHRDAQLNAAVLQSNSSGSVQFNLDVTVAHALILSSRHGSVTLTAATCVPPVGIFDSVTSTCRLTQDIPDGDVFIVENGFKLDCRDPTTQARHTIGSSVATSAVGIAATLATDVEVRECDIVNVDFGISLFAAPRFKASGVNMRGPPLGGGVFAGQAFNGGDIVGVDLSGLDVADFGTGIVGPGLSDLRLADSQLATARARDCSPMVACTSRPGLGVFVTGSQGVVLDHVTVDAVAASDPMQLGSNAVWLNASTGIVVRNISVNHAEGYLIGLAVVNQSGASSLVQDNTVSGATLGVYLDEGNTLFTGNSLTQNQTGLSLGAGVARVFHNNIFLNGLGVQSVSPIELSDTRPTSPTFQQGNYWGRACPGPLFIPGADTMGTGVVDSFPYAVRDAWSLGAPPGCVPQLPLAITTPADGALLNNPRPTISGTAPPASAVSIFSDGAPILTTITADAGTFSGVPATALDDGAHELVAVATTDAGISPPSHPVRIVIDTTSPRPPVLLAPAPGSTISEATAPIFGIAEPGSEVTLRDGAAPLGHTQSNADGTFTFVPVSALSAGAHSVVAIARDAAGNASQPSAPLVFTVRTISAAAPLIGSKGWLKITELSDAPDPVAAAGPHNIQTALGTMRGVQGLGGNSGQHAFSALVERVFVDPRTGAEVASITSSNSLISGTPTVAVSAQNSWDGKSSVGAPVAAATYITTTRVAVVRIVPGQNCGSPFAAGASPACVIDVTPPAVATVTVLPPPTGEVCDGADNDADGEVDEGCSLSCPAQARGALRPAALDVTLSAMPSINLSLPMISECEFTRLLSSTRRLAATTPARRAAVEAAALSNASTALGVAGPLIGRATLAPGAVLVARNPALTASGGVQSTDFFVAALSMGGTVEWMAPSATLFSTAPPQPSCSSAFRGCAPLPRRDGGPQRFSSALGGRGGLPAGAVLNAEAGRRPSNASGKTIELKIFSDDTLEQEENRFICSQPTQVIDCPLAAPPSGNSVSSASTQMLALPVDAVLIAEDDFVRIASSTTGPPINSAAVASIAGFAAAANHPAAVGVIAQRVNSPHFSAPVVVVARDPVLAGGTLNATQYYFSGPLSGNASWVGRSVRLGFKADVQNTDFSNSLCGPLVFPDLVGPCPGTACVGPPFSWLAAQGDLGNDRFVVGLSRATVRLPQGSGALLDITALACTQFLSLPPSNSGLLRCDIDPLTGRLVPEACNGRDDNCNGQIDEGIACVVVPQCTRDSQGRCVPRTCAGQCGDVPDGCGGVLRCGGPC